MPDFRLSAGRSFIAVLAGDGVAPRRCRGAAAVQPAAQSVVGRVGVLLARCPGPRVSPERTAADHATGVAS